MVGGAAASCHTWPIPAALRLSHPLATMAPVTRTEPLRISCDDCALQSTAACSDCVVSYLLAREPDDAVVVELDELQALRTLGAGGLVPALRHEERAPC